MYYSFYRTERYFASWLFIIDWILDFVIFYFNFLNIKGFDAIYNELIDYWVTNMYTTIYSKVEDQFQSCLTKVVSLI